MFTIKLYSEGGFRQRILMAESFTILRGDYGRAEITLHQKNSHEDRRIDIDEELPPEKAASSPDRYQRAIIENSAGKTTEIIQLMPVSTPIAA